ncbi:hypothetical protein MPUL_48780 [Mycolicibacterium pulveris]|uniref:Rieske domain-containing protein n=1 Tax=Mycolicibacterium pulveris TaxID=36813 RepID=A0A7I7URP7_MYCPV|nr:hypothetical protein MPUL_48780 [Mycolicibacterium pulveris]
MQWSDRISPGTIEQVRVGERNLVVYRGQGGRAHVADAVTPDRGLPLTEAEVVGDSLRSCIDGKIWPPGDSDGTAGDLRPLRRYPVSEQAGLILVGIGATESMAPALGDGGQQWTPVADEPTWVGEGSVQIALENLCDAHSLGYLLGGVTVSMPQVVSTAPGDLHMRCQVSDPDSGGAPAQKLDVRATSPGLMWIQTTSGAGVLFAVTPLDEHRVAIRACRAGRGDDGLDWSGCIARQVELTGLIRRVPVLVLSDEERQVADSVREWLGAVA